MKSKGHDNPICHFNLDQLVSNVANDRGKLKSLLDTLAMSSFVSIERAIQAAHSMEVEKLQDSIHRLKGCVALAGAEKLATLCDDLIESLADEFDWNAASDHIHHIKRITYDAMDHLDNEFNQRFSMKG